ncbi:hydroxyacylglutathione hydrolase [Natrinema saccharevitans]|uniref:Hydroxyacylglutathione hydrolase n=1 Tax=Natrinema saccharevitans TaxID=301967 RepID=A0A1S8AR80_9EURY|nr:MBL fold metallo-hydrolase [Natrinema saccharevitans]OLZ39170.1 hydroxyacylglutathione hydrolase [Natrinema saccharevitans]
MSGTNRTDETDRDARVHRLEFTVEWPPGHAAAYVIPGDEPILIDAGTPGERGAEELRAELDDHGYAPSDIDHVVLTHGHTDHVGQTPTLLEAGSPTVYAPTQLRDRYERDMETVAERTRTNLLEAGLEPEYLDSASDRLLSAHRTVREALPADAVDVWIDDDPFTVGTREIDPIYSPGHHISHSCFGTTLDGDRVVFSGDMAMEPFRAPSLLVNFDDGVEDSVRTFYATLERLKTYQFERVFPGHGPVHDRYEKCLDRSIADLESKLEQCLDRIESGRVTAFQIAAERAGTKRGISRILAETVGLVEYLEDGGAVRSVLDDGVRFYESK